MPRIAFEPSGKTVDVAVGANLADAVRGAGFHLPTPCGGKGLCGKCRVRILAGGGGGEEWRNACTVAVEGDLVVADPDPGQNTAVLTDFAAHAALAANGVWRRTVRLDKPGGNDQENDVDRLRRALAGVGVENVEMPLGVLRRLPGALRDNGFDVEAVGVGGRLLDVRGVGDGAPLLGLAVDLGTTTLAGALCDLENGAVLAVASCANPQAVRGDDVISRIDHAAKGKDELGEMRGLAVEAIHALAVDALREAGMAGAEVLLLAVGGNTVMNHLLVGVDPAALAVSPFVPCFRDIPPVDAAAVGWPGGHGPTLLVVPNIAAYVGGDITAGILAHGVGDDRGNVLLLDIGTNGEIVLRAKGKTYACAAAAGPAFEGARIGQGMRAVPGAICRVGVGPGGGLDVGTVDGVRPAKGICGTGLLDAVAALRAVGVVDEGGRLLEAEEAEEEGVAAAVRERLFTDGDGAAVWLEAPGEGSGGVRLTQRDVRELQLAKGAIAAGVRVLLGVAGIAAEEVGAVLLAGGFGNYLRPESALAVGILPGGVALGRIRSVGNASLAGTRLYLVAESERRRAVGLSAAVEYVELSGREDFQSAFAEEMLFPEL